MPNKKIEAQSIPAMNRGKRFAEVEYPENLGATLKRISEYFAYEKAKVIYMFIIVILGTFCGIYAPSMQSKAIDIISGKENGALYATVIIMMIAYLLYSGSQLLQGFISAKLSQGIVKRLRDELFEKIMNLPISYIDGHSRGDVMSRMTNDIENISTTVSQSLPSLFSGVLTIIGTAIVMLWYSWQLALLSFLSIFLTVFATKFLSKKVRKFSRSRQSLLGNINGTVEEMIYGYRTVVAYNQQENAIKKFIKNSDSLTKAGIRTDIFSGVMGPVMNCIGNISFVIIAVFGGYFAINGVISVGVISAFIVYAKQFSRPVNELAQIYGRLQTAIAGAERVFMILDEKNEDKSGKILNTDNGGEVSFENVNFSYEEGQPIIKDFSLKIPSGKKVALVGETGSGKTTIVNLLMRYYDIDSGKIKIDGQDIKEVSRESLRKNLAIVLQDTVLFSDTIENNLKYGNKAATREQIEDSVIRSGCKDMIDTLPEGYDTILTSSGGSISKGQRQLLAIAQAFVADPKILILDEATSNIDTRTEKSIQDAMHEIMKNRTSIVIAHRLSTIRDADLIIVMDKGRMVESGNHNELLEQKGKYYQLYITQYAGFEI